MRCRVRRMRHGRRCRRERAVGQVRLAVVTFDELATIGPFAAKHGRVSRRELETDLGEGIGSPGLTTQPQSAVSMSAASSRCTAATTGRVAKVCPAPCKFIGSRSPRIVRRVEVLNHVENMHHAFRRLRSANVAQHPVHSGNHIEAEGEDVEVHLRFDMPLPQAHQGRGDIRLDETPDAPRLAQALFRSRRDHPLHDVLDERRWKDRGHGVGRQLLANTVHDRFGLE